jgi:ABC-type phosphate/phosphonate transport system substrate-binding protein
MVALASLGPSGGTAWGAAPVPIRVGVATDILMDVSRKDAQASFEVWLKQLTGEGGTAAETRSVFLDDPGAMAAAIQRNDVDLVLLPTLTFLQLERLPLEPVRVGLASRASLDVELLLVHRESARASLADLAGKRLMLQPGAVGTMSQLWLDVLLAKQGLPEAGHFFSQIGQGMRASQVVLPVFFRQAEAAVVKEASFATVGEMNPQVAKDVVVLARSPELLHGVVCFNKQIAPEPRRLLMDGLQRMDTSPAGRQILTLFRVSRLLPFDPAQLVGVLGLVREHATLLGRRGG